MSESVSVYEGDICVEVRVSAIKSCVPSTVQGESERKTRYIEDSRGCLKLLVQCTGRLTNARAWHSHCTLVRAGDVSEV